MFEWIPPSLPKKLLGRVIVKDKVGGGACLDSLGPQDDRLLMQDQGSCAQPEVAGAPGSVTSKALSTSHCALELTPRSEVGGVGDDLPRFQTEA